MRISMRIFQRNGWFYYEFERGKPRSLRTRDHREARGLYNALKKKYLQGKLHNLETGRRITISEFQSVFFRDHTDISDHTIEGYRVAFKLFTDVIGAPTLITHIDRAKIQRFKNACLARGVKKVSVNSYLRHIRGILNKAFEWGYAPKKVPVVMLKVPKRHPRILSPDEIDLVLLHSQHCHFQMHRIIKFALWTAARREEIHTLKWQNVHLDQGFCTVLGKGDKERTVPLLDGAIEALGQPKDIGYVFWHPHVDSISRSFKKIARDCGIEDISFHKLRHTSATKMLQCGIGLSEVKEMLGHEDVKTTEIYAQVLREHLKKEMQKFRI